MDQISKIVVVVMGMIILPLITSNLQAQIVSAPGGGIWNDSFTWIGGSIPTASDSVVINSTVYVSTGTNECNGLYISPTGIITNYTSGNNTLTVHGSITNEGVIQNNTYNFYINLYGDVYQNGIWTNYRTTFSNSVSQRIQGTQPFSGSDLFNADPANTVYVDSDFAFQGTEIDLNGGTFHIADNNTITLMGSYTNDVNFVSNGFILKGYYNSFVANTTFDNVTIEGTVHIHNNNSVTQTITVEDTLQNLTSGNYPLVTVNIVNNGTIRNNTYNFYVHISGNMTNNGTWENYNTYFNGTGLQELVFTNVFSGARFERNEMSGHLVAQSDLWFANTEIDLDNDTLDFQTGSNIYFDGGNVTNTFFTKQALPALGISGSNGFYFLNFTLDAQLSDFNDDVLFSSGNMLYGDILISGTIRNRNSGSYSVNIDGNLENNGTVTNYTYNFSLYVTGNIENHGTWDNYTIFMNGDEDQDISGTSTFKPGYFRSQKTMGNLTASSDISFQNCTIDLDGDTLLFTSGQELALDYCLLDAAHIMKNNALSNPLHINLSTDAYVRNSRFKADSMYLGGIFRVANSPVEFYGNVVVSGTLQNHTAGSYEASIYGSLINKGIINNIIYNFTIDLYGDLYNHGTWTNYDVNLESSDIQNFYTYAPVSMVNLDNTNQDGILKAQTNLMFSGVDIDLFDDTLAFDQGSELILSNTAFYRGKVINEGPESSLPLVLDLSSNSYIRNSEFVSDSIILKGTVQIYGSPMNFHGNVANLGTLTGFPTGTHTAYFIGNLSNLGTIKNQIYVLNVYISGNMHNEGTWNNTNTYLNGTSLQYISMSEALETANFTNLNGSDMMAVSDLVFDNTDIDLNGADFTIGEDLNVFIKDGFIRECSMISNHFNLGMSGSYCRDIAIGNVSLFGEIKTYLTNNTFTGDVVVEGTLSSSGFGSSTVTFQGNVTNNGSISNSTYVLNVIALGDLTNNGTWNNYNTRLDGTADDQHITLVNSKPIVSQVTFDANLTTGTTFAWAGPSGYLSAFPAEFTGANTQVVSFLNPVVDADVGEYYCSNDAFDESRKIYIHSTSVPEYQLDLTLLLEGPYNGSEMNTTLNSSDNLPLAQPYYDYPWIYPGSEAVGSIPSADVVDWVYLELHDASSAGSADESTQFDRLIGLLLKDGSVVDLDGSSLPDFNGPINNGLFVNVLHRNHLGVLSATALTESGGIYSYDFTSGNGQAYGSNVQTDLGGGLYGLRGGDADKDGDVDATDYDIWASEAGNKAGYNNTDFNLDTEIDNKDKNEAQFGNLGISAK